MTQLNIENSSQAIKNQNQAKYSPNLKNQAIKKIKPKGIKPKKKHLRDLGEKCLSDLSGKFQEELGGN